MRFVAPRKEANAFAHGVFAHHFRLPKRGEKMAHSMFALLLHSKKEDDVRLSFFQAMQEYVFQQQLSLCSGWS